MPAARTLKKSTSSRSVIDLTTALEIAAPKVQCDVLLMASNNIIAGGGRLRVILARVEGDCFTGRRHVKCWAAVRGLRVILWAVVLKRRMKAMSVNRPLNERWPPGMKAGWR